MNSWWDPLGITSKPANDMEATQTRAVEEARCFLRRGDPVAYVRRAVVRKPQGATVERYYAMDHETEQWFPGTAHRVVRVMTQADL